MAQISPVIVGVDFSNSSRRALDLAAVVSARLGAPLVVLHVWNPNHLAGSASIHPHLESWIEEHRSDLAGRLEEWADVARSTGAAASARIIEGVASRRIPDEAASARARLVVVGQRGSANLSHVLLGSISERVVHQSPCPVLVVPDNPTTSVPPRRLLVGVDLSQASRDAYRAALELAEAFEAERGLVLLHARAYDWGAESEESCDTEALERWARHAGEGGTEVVVQMLEGRTEKLLIRTAEREDCDWIVLGLQGRGALAAFLLGSTTDRTLKLTDRPVLVVPPTSNAPGESTG